jgi:type I restriction enzyme S subunit
MKKGWQTKTLGDVCHVYQPATISQKQMIAGEFRVYGANGQIGWHNQFNHEEPELILGCRGSCGTVHVTEPQSWINGNAMVVHPTNGAMDISFLAYALKGGIELTDAITGAAQPQITRTSLMPLVISFPESLAEQQRIVDLLDEAFEGLATAKANAEQNLQNARALFESHLQAVFSQRGEGWVETTVGAEIRFIDYRGKTPVKTESGIRLITAKNVKMGYLQESPMEYIAADNYESWMTRGIPKKGDVLFTTEAPLANVAQLDTDEKVAFAQRIIIMQPNAEKLDCTFLKYLLLSQPVQERIRSKGTGATVQGIKASLLKTIEISFPISLQEQRRIVAQLDALALETRSLARLYERKLAALEELKKSLLHQAFSGEL